MIYLGKMDYVYKIITPDFKTAKEISADEKITPQVGDFVCLDNKDYKVTKVLCTHDYDKNTQVYEVFLDEC